MSIGSIMNWKFLFVLGMCATAIVYLFHLHTSTLVYKAVPKNAVQEMEDETHFDILACKCNSSKRIQSFSKKEEGSHRNREKSLCSKSATSRGAHQRVISYVIFGSPDDSRVFNDHFIQIVNLTKRAMDVYPEWTIRLHARTAFAFHKKIYPILCRLLCERNNFDVCLMENLDNERFNMYSYHQPNGMFWRFLPLLDPLVDVMISRDIDAFLLDREVGAVAEWLSSNYSYHVMRDHPSHGGNMLGGLWGVKVADIRVKDAFMWRRFLYTNVGGGWGPDQKLLSDTIYDDIRDNLIQHDSYFCHRFRAALTRPFPVKRDKEFNWCGGGDRLKGLNKLVAKHPCPVECRPKQHKDWNFC